MQGNLEENQDQIIDENHLIKIRKDKLKELQQQGKDPFQITKFDRTHISKNIIDNFDSLEGKDVVIAGRIMAKRIMGKASFGHVQDPEGKLQSYVSLNQLGEEEYNLFKTYDIGDIVRNRRACF